MNSQMDNVSPANIRQLKLAGEAMVNENDNDINNLIDLLNKLD
jgi:hypothetical protein